MKPEHILKLERDLTIIEADIELTKERSMPSIRCWTDRVYSQKAFSRRTSNMLLDRKASDRFASDKRQADASMKSQIDFIMSNLNHLKKANPKGRMAQAACSFRDMIRSGEEFTPGQRSYCENIYEATMRGLGLPSCRVHSDQKRKGLKFG